MDYLAASRWLLDAGARPARRIEHIRRDTIVAAPLDDTFAFFADAANLEWLTPPWLGFRVTTPLPLTMREGVEIDYRITIYGLRIPWRSRIDAWLPGEGFVDRQTIGPYRWWRHEHRFAPTAAGTRVIDEVEYAPRLHWMTAWLVRRDLERIFDYRQQRLMEHFDGHRRDPRRV